MKWEWALQTLRAVLATRTGGRARNDLLTFAGLPERRPQRRTGDQVAQDSRSDQRSREAPSRDASRSVVSDWDTTKTSGVAAWEQKRRLARAMRLVIERLVPSNAPEAELRAAADGLEHYAEALRAHPRLKSTHGFAESANAGDVGAFFDQSPLIGLANPLAPPISIARDTDNRAVATVTFGSAYEGPPGSVHGGFVAAAFDEVLGYVQSMSGKGGMTGTLTVRYRQPTPLHQELFFEGEITRIEGRKIFTEGRLFAGDVLTAEAEGIFISVDPSRFEELLKKRGEYEEAQLQTSNEPGGLA